MDVHARQRRHWLGLEYSILLILLAISCAIILDYHAAKAKNVKVQTPLIKEISCIFNIISSRLYWHPRHLHFFTTKAVGESHVKQEYKIRWQ